MDRFLQAALDEALEGLSEGGIPIGSVIVHHGVELTVLNDPSCVRMMEVFIRENPNLWNEDIGEA